MLIGINFSCIVLGGSVCANILTPTEIVTFSPILIFSGYALSMTAPRPIHVDDISFILTPLIL